MKILLLIAMLLAFHPATGYLLCPRAASPTYFDFPPELDCNQTDIYTHGFLDLYVPNIALREIKATLIWKEELTCTTKYFFFGSYTETVTKTIVPLRLSEAQGLYKDDYCDNVNKEHQIKCEYSWPHEKVTSKSYCLKMQGELIVSKGEILSSTLGDMSHCSLGARHCLLTNDKHIFWNADIKDTDEFKPPVNYSYVTVGGRYLINKVSLSLKLTGTKYYKGNLLTLTREGFMVKITSAIEVRSSNWDRFDFEAARRVKREIGDRAEMEGKIQYLFDYVYSFLGKTPMLCILVNLQHRVANQNARLQPTAFARAALRNSQVIAHSTENFLIVSPCIDIKSSELPYFNSNTSSIQIKVNMRNSSHIYNLDPTTDEITLHVQKIVHPWELPMIIEIDNRTYKLYKDRINIVSIRQQVRHIPVFQGDNLVLPHLDLDEAWVYTKEDLSDKAYWNFINNYQDTQEQIYHHDTNSHSSDYEDESKYDLKIPFLSNLTNIGALLDTIRTLSYIGGLLYLYRIIIRSQFMVTVTTCLSEKRKKLYKSENNQRYLDAFTRPEEWAESIRAHSQRRQKRENIPMNTDQAPSAPIYPQV